LVIRDQEVVGLNNEIRWLQASKFGAQFGAQLVGAHA